MRIGILGRTKALYDTIKALREQGHTIAFILTSREQPEYGLTADDFEILALNELEVPFRCTSKMNSPEMADWINRQDAEIGISINWKTVIPLDIINLFKHGIINAHLGDLPRFRGNATPAWHIINGEYKSVLSLHLMDSSLDSGPILLQRSMVITPDTYVGELYSFIEEACPSMFVEVLEYFENGTISPRLQNENDEKALRCYPRLPEDGLIDWKQTAEDIYTLVRANSEPLSGAYTFHKDRKLIIWRACPKPYQNEVLGTPGQVAEINKSTGEVSVITGNGFLVLKEVGNDIDGVRYKATDIIKSARTRLRNNISNEHILNAISRVKDLHGINKINNRILAGSLHNRNTDLVSVYKEVET